jgi:hypothetical protein
MAGERSYVDWIVTRNEFPQFAAELNEGARKVEERTAEAWRDAAKEVLYPGHGEDTGFLKDHIIAEGNQVRSEASYSGLLNDGWAHHPGYGFWDQGEMEARQVFEDEIWALVRRVAR